MAKNYHRITIYFTEKEIEKHPSIKYLLAASYLVRGFSKEYFVKLLQSRYKEIGEEDFIEELVQNIPSHLVVAFESMIGKKVSSVQQTMQIVDSASKLNNEVEKNQEKVSRMVNSEDPIKEEVKKAEEELEKLKKTLGLMD
jgi:predicted RNA-binding protein with PIN domain